MTTSDSERAEHLAAHGVSLLGSRNTKEAAWLGLSAAELDPQCGLALALLAQILSEINPDPLATIATRRALALGIPDAYRPSVENFHRMDLWRRGLLRHARAAAILPATAFADADAFSEMQSFDAWHDEQSDVFGGDDGTVRALLRMSAALSDAWIVPTEEEDPLRADLSWAQTEAYRAWLASDLAGWKAKPLDEISEGANGPSDELSVLSDHWIEQEIASLGASGQFDLAYERAALWVAARPDRILPRAIQLRVAHALGNAKECAAIANAIIGMQHRDLNELEEARIVFGELELWAPQIELLDQMNEIAPDHPVILTNRGAARMEVGEADQGAADLERAIDIDPQNAPALANLGLHRMREDNYVAARTLLEQAVVAAPEHAQVRVYLAACKNNQGDRDGAISELQQALELEPGHSGAAALLEELSEI